MTIEEFLHKITEIDLTQAQYVFSDWDDALAAYALKYKKHGSPNVVRLLKIATTLGELVDLYRGIVLHKYFITEDALPIKEERYKELMSYHHYKSGVDATLFERISTDSVMEQRLNFAYHITKLGDEINSAEANKRPIIRHYREQQFEHKSTKLLASHEQD